MARSKLFSRLTSWARAEPPDRNPRAFLEMVVDALRLAALPADQQVSVLPDFVHVPDEIAMTYDDAWVLVPQIKEAKLLNDEQYEALARLDRHFEEMVSATDGDPLWTIEAMQVDDRWAKSRQLAEDALRALGRAPEPPHLSGITWVPAGK
jgi:hypothetical protein